MKFLQREIGADFLPVILAQLEDLQLAQRVVKIRRIGSTALCLARSVHSSLITFFHEKVYALIKSHLAGMHLYADNEPGVAEQRILQLAQAKLQECSVVVRIRSRCPTVTLVEHHLFAVVSPAFRV